MRRRRSPSRSELIKGVNYCSGKQAGSTSQELWAPPCTLVPSLEQCAVRAACALFSQDWWAGITFTHKIITWRDCT